VTVKIPLVLIPGLHCNERLYAPQIARFAPEREVLVVNHARHSSFEAIVADIVAQIPYPRFALLGLSMGGMLAMQMLGVASERIAGLALLDTNHKPDTSERKLVRDALIKRAPLEMSAIVDTLFPIYVAPFNAQNAALKTIVQQMAVEWGVDVFIRQSMAIRDRTDQSSNLKQFYKPSLVLYGSEEQLCKPEWHMEMAELLPQSQLVVIDNAGHLPTLEQPEATNKAISAWLKRID
jgi:pimeloyl-ACP methyl ester carboxylesterase